MIAILFVFMVAATATLNPAEQAPVPIPEPAPVVIEKTIVIKCIPLQQGERLERDLTAPFEQRHYINLQGDGCHKKSETSIISGPLTNSAEQAKRSLDGKGKP